ncbi:hypothetical protein K488DRAFT_79769 [Vararia minispora EC-137]|uniref:Uncharacterized protein n=1 Tax=Vararia minispora EC-137 TaxID=1314806 RepID=A0ACB8QEC0_9AGAM|nr:hypothetical protein K488DRAFT_79769 [Vararia minispora EC-137]
MVVRCVHQRLVPTLRRRIPSTSSPCRTYATGFESENPLRKTGLFDFHVSNGAKMVPFGGWSMPLSYGSVGQVASHSHVRTHAGLFDVGHMVQHKFRGPRAAAFLEKLTPSSLAALPYFSSTLSVLLLPNGGILDDMIITKHADDAFYVVTNAGRRAEDNAWFRRQLDDGEWKDGVEWTVMDGWGLLALQGPEAAQILQQHTSEDLSKLVFGRSTYMKVSGVNVHVARGGYTGEDGFEISIPPEHTVQLAEVLSKPPVQLAGLGARDSLRIEAGMCLYGSDIDESTSPVEAGLSWVIGKDRRESTNFIGAETVLAHLRHGPPRRRVGLTVEGAPARHGAKIFAQDGRDYLGDITSGIPSPTLGKNIAMGYVTSGHHKKGTSVAVEVRGKLRDAMVVPMPFVKARYFRG